MTNRILSSPLLFMFLLIAAACGGGGSSSSANPAPEAPPADPSIALDRAFPNLTFNQPLAMVQPPGDDSRWFLAEKGGRVLTFVNQPNTTSATVAIDLGARVESAPSEAGLLGIAFHPRFAENGTVFLSYTAPGSPLISRISRFSSPDRTTIDPTSEQILLTLDQPFANHNGGNISFGPDGFLYIGFGDGGSGGDPQGNGQNTETLLGAILRLDVDGTAPESAYAIPADNPFAEGGGRAEIFAWGLRNPWRFSFDRTTGLLWAADVGQNAWEEVDVIEIGGNYGWNIREGTHCFSPSTGCPTEGLIDPVAEYSTASPDCSVTGGYVYRGSAIPALQGTYLFGDFCSGRIRGLPLGDDGRPAAAHSLLLGSELSISSFAEGNAGEIYVLDLTGGGIWRIEAGR